MPTYPHAHAPQHLMNANILHQLSLEIIKVEKPSELTSYRVSSHECLDDTKNPAVRELLRVCSQYGAPQSQIWTQMSYVWTDDNESIKLERKACVKFDEKLSPLQLGLEDESDLLAVCPNRDTSAFLRSLATGLLFCV